jgi:hypothetical protein
MGATVGLGLILGLLAVGIRLIVCPFCGGCGRSDLSTAPLPPTHFPASPHPSHRVRRSV